MNHWIETPESLKSSLAAWAEHKIVALDTEFVREKTYYPQLALVQLGVPGEILLIDPLVPGMAEEVKPLLLESGIRKIIHSPSEDLQAFARGVGAVPVNIFDTQAAAALSGMGAGLGYQKLVELITGHALEKGETRSDWLKRPLTDSQCRYAADDVHYLHEVHDVLSEKLIALNRLHWLEADGERAVRNANNDVDDPFPHLSLSRAQGLDQPAQAMLCRILKWRDAKARSSDKPKSWILDNELAPFLRAAHQLNTTPLLPFSTAVRKHPVNSAMNFGKNSRVRCSKSNSTFRPSRMSTISTSKNCAPCRKPSRSMPAA